MNKKDIINYIEKIGGSNSNEIKIANLENMLDSEDISYSDSSSTSAYTNSILDLFISSDSESSYDSEGGKGKSKKGKKGKKGKKDKKKKKKKKKKKNDDSDSDDDSDSLSEHIKSTEQNQNDHTGQYLIPPTGRANFANLASLSNQQQTNLPLGSLAGLSQHLQPQQSNLPLGSLTGLAGLAGLANLSQHQQYQQPQYQQPQPQYQQPQYQQSQYQQPQPQQSQPQSQQSIQITPQQMQILAPILSQLINNSNIASIPAFNAPAFNAAPVFNATPVATPINNGKILNDKIEVNLNKVDNEIDELKKKLNL